MSKLNSTDSCALIDVEKETLDPRCAEIHDEELKALFEEIHRVIFENGLDLVKNVNNVYEFVI